MPIFPGEPKWPDEWLKVCLSQDRETHFRVHHLQEVLKNKGVLTRLIGVKGDVLELWVPSWKQGTAVKLAKKLEGPTLKYAEPIASELVAEPVKATDRVVDQIASEISEIAELGPSETEFTPVDCQKVRITRQSRSWIEVMLIGAEWLCATILGIFTGVAVLVLLFLGRGSFVELGLLIVFVMSGVGLVFRYLRRMRREREQKRRNNQARQIFEMARVGRHTSAYALYLRPFESDYRFTEGEEVRKAVFFIGILNRVFKPTSFFPERMVSLELLFANALWSYQPLIAIGKSDLRPGPGLIELPDSEWKRAFAALAHQAVLILVLPGASQGSLFEVAWLKKKIGFAKMVIFKPRRVQKYEYWWSRVQEAYLDLGVQLPELTETAGLLTVSEDASVIREVTIRQMTLGRIRNAFRDLDRTAHRSG